MVKVLEQFRECKIKSLLTSSPGPPFFPLNPFGPRSPLAPCIKNCIKKRCFVFSSTAHYFLLNTSFSSIITLERGFYLIQRLKLNWNKKKFARRTSQQEMISERWSPHLLKLLSWEILVLILWFVLVSYWQLRRPQNNSTMDTTYTFLLPVLIAASGIYSSISEGK